MAQSNFTPELQAILKRKTPNGAEIFKLIKRYKKYRKGKRKEELREEILTINAKLVAYLAQKQSIYSDASVDDLFSAGMTGLIHALDKFSYRKGFRFSTYATFWIKRNMQILREEDQTISVSRHNRGLFSKMMKEADGKIDFGNMDAKKKRALSVLNAINTKRYLYLDQEIESTDSDTFKIEIRDPVNYEENIFKKLIGEEIVSVMSKILTDRERIVITKRYLEPIKLTYAAILKEEGITIKSVEMLRISEMKALRKLKVYLRDAKKIEEEAKEKREEDRQLMEALVDAKEEARRAEILLTSKEAAKEAQKDKELDDAFDKVYKKKSTRVLSVGTRCIACKGSGRHYDTDLNGKMIDDACIECNGWGGKVMFVEKPFSNKNK